MRELYLPTGNEYVSLPDISERTAAICSFSCLHMGAKGLVEFHGDGSVPVMAPFVHSRGANLPLTDMVGSVWNTGRRSSLPMPAV